MIVVQKNLKNRYYWSCGGLGFLKSGQPNSTCISYTLLVFIFEIYEFEYLFLFYLEMFRFQVLLVYFFFRFL
jgi:hypothetical protein